MPAAITEFVNVNISLVGASVDKFGFGDLLGVFAHTVNADRQNGPYSSITEVEAAGFTSVAEPAVHAWATTVFSQGDGVDRLIIGLLDAVDAGDYAVALSAIEAAGPNPWYITTIASRLDADLGLVAAWHEARQKIFIGQSDDLTSVEFLLWQAAGYNNSAGFYHATDAEYLDGAIASSGGGLNLDAPDGAGIWAYRQLSGVPFDPITSAQAVAIYAADANLYGRNSGTNFTSKGTMASGRFIDVTTTIHWLTARLEEAWLALAVGAPKKIPYTDAGINLIVAELYAVLNRGVDFGHFSPDEPTRVIAPLVADVATQDKIDRKITIAAEAVLAGAIQHLTVEVALEF